MEIPFNLNPEAFEDRTHTAFLTAILLVVSLAFFAAFLPVLKGESIEHPEFIGITKYYDSRQFGMIVSGDDCEDYNIDGFDEMSQGLISRKIHFSIGIITNYASPGTWSSIQNWVNSGYVEPCSHSATHPNVTEEELSNHEYHFEIKSSKEHILGNLTMPSTMTKGDKEYLYAFIEPYGESDSTEREKLGQCKYLADRSIEEDITAFTSWDDPNDLFERCGVTRYFQDAYGGQTNNTELLNQAFDDAYTSGHLYHVFVHPGQNVNAYLPNFYEHMDHCEHNSSCWYVGLGQAYLYHYVASRDIVTHSACMEDGQRVHVFSVSSSEHDDYGLSYPITYEFQLPETWTDCKAQIRYDQSDYWIDMTEKQSGDLFNGIECFRIDYDSSRAYVSCAFDSQSDEVHIRLLKLAEAVEVVPFTPLGSGGLLIGMLFGALAYLKNRR